MKRQQSYDRSLEAILSKLRDNPLEARPQEHLEIHFDVPNNMISAKTLSEVANGIQDISDVIFDGVLPEGGRAEIYLCPPKDGCFEADFVVVAAVTFATFRGIAAPTFINSICKELIGRDIAELFDFLGQQTGIGMKEIPAINYISTLISLYLDQKAPKIPLSPNVEHKRQRRRLQKGKNRIFIAIEEDETIAKISLDGNRIIDRPTFPEYIYDHSDEDEIEAEVGFYQGEIKVISPVSIKVTSRRGWTGHLLGDKKNHAERTFEIDDQKFRQYAIVNNLKPAVDDLIEVQMIKDDSAQPQWRVKRVLKFKGITISPPLSGTELAKLSVKPLFEKVETQGNFLSVLDHK
ncbi:hypothetical protein [Salidesulfovibrio onnuriiensis]|uniref:hypothetical protein n=1 Tax=Salidesulfovibrio onnuriiensis TaxID=2583823 RepID=UPI0011C721EF|nr:hypothetical protein [Salidesulfovibrio onnuriiensis]